MVLILQNDLDEARNSVDVLLKGLVVLTRSLGKTVSVGSLLEKVVECMENFPEGPHCVWFSRLKQQLLPKN